MLCLDNRCAIAASLAVNCLSCNSYIKMKKLQIDKGSHEFSAAK